MEDFWVVYALATWQSGIYKDADPSTLTSDLGQTDPLAVGAVNMAAIYVETIRESEGLPLTPRIVEKVVEPGSN
jgi:hypothetical protein